VKAIKHGVELQELSLEELRLVSALIDADVFEALSLEHTLGTKSQIGGTSPARVSEALVAARKSLIG
jgi:argininosuccinate lyase